MPRSPLLTYLVARQGAAILDRQGAPGAFLRMLYFVMVLCALGLAGCVLFVVVSFGLWELGIG